MNGRRAGGCRSRRDGTWMAIGNGRGLIWKGLRDGVCVRETERRWRRRRWRML